MTKPFQPLKFHTICAIAVLLVFTVVSCTPATVLPTPTPVILTIEVTREVTQEVTLEITRVVEVPVPVMITPTPTLAISLTPSLTSTITSTPTVTPTTEPPVVTILVRTACNYGPGDVYLYNYTLDETWVMEIIGRNLDGTWLYVQEVHGWNPCWVRAELVRFNAGGETSINDIPIVYPALPYSNLYRTPENVDTKREGSLVTLSWHPVWMTRDDYRGYLIEAWLCHGGQQVFQPVVYVTSFDENEAMIANNSTIALEIIDEPGCLSPSSARIYTAEKHGYSALRLIHLPPY
jgi:hypothetical protein